MKSASAALLLSFTVLPGLMLASNPAAAAGCAGLSSLALPNTTITLAQTYSAGDTVVGTTEAPTDLCRVAGTVKPGPESNVKFEVWIPTDGSWNGKYQQVGCGGFCGAIQYGAVANAVSRGYAAASTDDGTSGNPPAVPSGAPAFIGNNDVLLDYGYRAIKVTTDDSKALIKAFTGQEPTFSYFVGCSDGGREALKEAQRYPEDFDGIVVGSPVNDQVGEFGSSYLYDSQAVLNGPQSGGVPDAYLTPIALAALDNGSHALCVGKDGGVATDAFLSDPRQCLFDPATVACKSGQIPSVANPCLTPAQVEAAKKIYAGPHDQRGNLLFPGYEPGNESLAGNWGTWIPGGSPASPGLQYVLGYGFGCDLMQGVQSCNYLGIDVDQQDATARKTLQPILSSIDPDLSAFKRHGGKMIHYVGWNDTAIAPQNSVNYYRTVEHTMGDVRSFYRLFMVPGMSHCGGGAGPNAFGNGTANGPVIDAQHDLVKALEAWVEQGIAPNTIIATHYVNNTAAQGAQFQRPLCPFPERGKYVGAGDPSSASSFKCVVHRDDFDPRNIGPQTAYHSAGDEGADRK
jgi:Tannase and feruloyl esterase